MSGFEFSCINTYTFIFLPPMVISTAPEGEISIDVFAFTSNSSLSVNWTEPAFPNGELRYQVNLTLTDLFTLATLQLASVEVVTPSNVFEVQMSFYMEYNVTVVPFTDVGEGSGKWFPLRGERKSSYLMCMRFVVLTYVK